MLPAGVSPRHYQGDAMKKNPKKLVLAKETLRSLGDLDLKAMMVAGG